MRLQVEEGEYQNCPVVRTDVIREEDRNDAEELPEQGIANTIANKFKHMERESEHLKSYRPSGIGTKVRRPHLGTYT